MRKITVVFLVLAIMTLFVSCVGDDGTETTNNTLNTGIALPTESTSAVETTTAPSAGGVTYILTTSPDKTVPWSSTTRFEIDPYVPQTTGSSLPNVSYTGGDIPRPSVNTSQLSTQPTTPGSDTQPSTSDTTTTKKPTTNNKTTQATTSANKTPTQLVINDTSYNSSTGIVTLAISNDGWMSEFAASSQNIEITVDGEKLQTTVPCAVTAKVNADGCQLITIDLSSQSLNSGSNVTFTIPAGLVQTKAGTQYNTSYTGYIVL